MIEVRKNILKKIYKKRKPSTHKYDFGSLLIIGGSKLYSGSPAFAALSAIAAYRTGVDLVTVAAPERAANIVASFSPDMITYPLKGNYIAKTHLKELFYLAENKSAIVIGGGIERRKETLSTVAAFLKKITLPCVIDADAIHAVTKNKKIIANKKFVITPHPHEFYILTNKKTEKTRLEKRIKVVKESAQKLKTTILLKGHVDIISNGKKTAINKTGSPFMSVGGTGDTLVGILGSLLAQGIDTFTATCAAAYINGKAGEIVAKEKKQTMIASDLIKAIVKVIT